MSSIYGDTEIEATSYSPNMTHKQMKPLMGKLGMKMNLSEAEMHDCLSRVETGQTVDEKFYKKGVWAKLSATKKAAAIASPAAIVILIIILWLIFKQ